MFYKNLFRFSFLALVLTSCSQTESDIVPFLNDTPVIDGQLDGQLTKLKKRNFNHIWQFDNPVTDTVPVSYRMAYTPEHLYLYIETETDSINYRRRGFVQGDGFKLLLAKPQKDSLTNEYYDLVFSPSKDKNYWARKRIWEYNHDQSHNRPLSESTKLKAISSSGKSGFEALISWRDIPPYHPWFMKEMGYNLYFAKAIGDTITNGYAVVPDDGIWNEEVPKRNYEVLDFEVPEKTAGKQLQFQLKQRNSIEGQALELSVASLNGETETLSLTISIYKDKQELVDQSLELEISAVFQQISTPLQTQKLSEGQYEVVVQNENGRLFTSSFTILPDIDLSQIYEAVQANLQGVNKGAQHTLMFKIGQYEKGLKALKPYETGNDLIRQFEQGNIEFNQFVNGMDPYAEKENVYRRAFLSGQDSTYQPYSIKLPKGYTPKKKYPLLVFLHGSGSTDEGLLNAARSNGDFIEIAPYGRDMFRAYAAAKSQKDIVEAIEDVQEHFSIDTDNIIIGGFSMGGYGALRTYFENPSLYKGIAVHAGHPNLANYWLGPGFPNFLDEKYLEPFKGKKVFIYHGTKDGSLPVKLAKELIVKMQTMGIEVTEAIVDGNGHQYPDKDTNNLYFEWLKKTIR